jgi:excisionase family DNA binding protein
VTKGWLRIREAATYSGVSARTLRDWLKQGLKSYRVKGALLVHPSDIDNFIKQFPTDRQDVDAIVDEAVKAMIGNRPA